jgi:iron complex outermembrane receptor protein
LAVPFTNFPAALSAVSRIHPRGMPVTSLFRISTLFAVLLQTALAETVTGRVVDPSGAAISRATVTITARDGDTRRSIRTDSAGEYRFDGLSAGEYLIEAMAPGFGSNRATVLTLEPGKSLDADLQLDLTKLTTQVQVTATGTAQSADESAKALDIIDAIQLDVRAKIAIPDAIRFTPGIRVQQLGGPGSLTRILSRGLPTHQTSLLIDGFRLRDAGSTQGDATAFLGDLLVVDTGSVEILRGSGSSLYGTNAAGAVINVITDQGGGRIRGDVLTEGGGLGLFRGAAKIAGGAAKDRLLYTAGIAHLNVTSGIDGNDRARNTSGQGFAQYNFTPSTSLSGRLFAARSYADLNVSPYTAATLPSSTVVSAIPDVTFFPSQNDPDSSRNANYITGLVALNQRLSESASIRVSYQGLSTSRDNRDGPAGPGFQPQFSNSSKFDGRIDTLQARADVRLGRYNFLTGGYEFERESYGNFSADQNPVAAQRVDARVRASQNSHAIYAQDQIRLLNNRLQFSFSGRIQRFSLSRPEFTGGTPLYASLPLLTPQSAYTGDGSVSYFLPQSGTKLRAHAGNSYRAPALYERFGSYFFFGSFSALGDPRLRPERLLSIDAGFDQYLLSSRLRVSGTYFYTRIQEAIVFDSGITPATDPFGRFGGYNSAPGGLARGVEIAAEASITRTTTVNSSYTYTNAKERTSALIGGYLPSIRIFKNMFTATASQRLGRKIDVAFDFLAASPYIYPLFAGTGSRAFEFDGPVRGDLVINFNQPISERQTLRFYTRIENVFNRTYFEDGFRTPKAWAVAGIKWIWN